jgi:hypothetical protein
MGDKDQSAAVTAVLKIYKHDSLIKTILKTQTPNGFRKINDVQF